MIFKILAELSVAKPAWVTAAPISPPMEHGEKVGGEAVVPGEQVPGYCTNKSSEHQNLTPHDYVRMHNTLSQRAPTSVPSKAPIRFKTAAIKTAARGEITLVDTTVAMALAQSCVPFVKSNTRATNTMMTRSTGISSIFQYHFLDSYE